MIPASTTNLFVEGLIKDFNPLVLPNNSYTNALNATLLTINGNENSLLNDLGNARVETAFLPEGYIPLGTCELGGIIYIVSYNPLINKCLIGSFPSPERNLTLDEIEDNIGTIELANDDFYESRGVVTNNLIKKKLTNYILHPGDKFIVAGNSLSDNEDRLIGTVNSDEINDEGYLKLKLATLDSNNRIIVLDNLLDYKCKEKYFNLKDGVIKSTTDTDLDAYRNMVGSNYNIFSSKIAGELYLIAELDIIDRFDITWEVIKIEENDYTLRFNITTDKNLHGVDIKHISGLNSDVVSNLSTQYFSPESDEPDILEDKYNYYIDLKFTYKKGMSNSSTTLEFRPIMKFGEIKRFNTQITIDFSDFGELILKLSTWKYYKEDSQIKLYYNLNYYSINNEKIESITQYFIPYDDVSITRKWVTDNVLNSDLNKYFHVLLEQRRSYNGHLSNTISFSEGGIQENSLYLVVFVLKSNIISENTKSTKYSIIEKCLYTSSIFNRYYLESNYDDFDQIQLEFEYDIKYDNVDVNDFEITTSLANLITEESTIYKEYTKNTLNLTISLNEKPIIKDNYHFFYVKDTILNSPQVTYKPLTVSDYKITKTNNIEGIEYLDDQIKNSSIQVNLETKKLKFSGDLYYPIIADSKEKQVYVENYFRPIVTSVLDLSKYGLTLQDNGHITMGNTFVGFGQSLGGGDNKGGGGHLSVKGMIKLGAANNENLTLVSVEVESDTPDAGKGSIDLPSANMSDYISSNYDQKVFAPVLLTPVGSLSWLTNNTSLRWYITSGTNTSLNRFNTFTSALTSSYRTMWLCIKTNDSSGTSYSLTNTMFRVVDTDLTLFNQPAGHSYITLGDMIGHFLMNVFVKNPNGNESITRYSVNNIGFVNSLEYILLVTIKYGLTLITDEDISLGIDSESEGNKLSLKNIRENFEQGNKNKFPCLTLADSELKEIVLDLSYIFKPKDMLKDKFIEFQNGVPSESCYIYSPFIPNLTIKENNLSGKLYLFPNAGRELQPASGTCNIYKIEGLLEVKENGVSTGLLSGSGYSSSRLFIIRNMDMFTYDYRSKEILIDNPTYLKNVSLVDIKWPPRDWDGTKPKDVNPVTFCNYELISLRGYMTEFSSS